MPFVNPFHQPGRWWRGNLHCHTTLSDGTVSPEERCAQYRQAGYDFLVITDHDVTAPVEGLCRDDFLVIPGIELHPPNPYGGDVYHIVGLNVTEPIDARRMQPVEVLRAVEAQGGLAVMVHPYWSGHLLSDYEPLERRYVALEVYNHIARRLNGTHNAEVIWDAHLDRLGPVWATVGDDAHGGVEDIGGAWVMVRAERRESLGVLTALRAGLFYSTQGPTVEGFEVELREGRVELHVHCSPVARIRFKGRTFSGRVFEAEPGSELREASYRCAGSEEYVRVELADGEGRHAWLNPVFLSEVTP